ncbi:MAG: zinc ribbon domain-containing protein [Eubacteriales bacterium]|nr:zinc ribbon domain-containing protein [Eubacteriales bacterium]
MERFCPKCGCRLPEDAVFCGNCGIRVPCENAGGANAKTEPPGFPAVSEPADQKTPLPQYPSRLKGRSRNTKVLVFAGLAALIVLVVVLTALLTKGFGAAGRKNEGTPSAVGDTVSATPLPLTSSAAGYSTALREPETASGNNNAADPAEGLSPTPSDEEPAGLLPGEDTMPDPDAGNDGADTEKSAGTAASGGTTNAADASGTTVPDNSGGSSDGHASPIAGTWKCVGHASLVEYYEQYGRAPDLSIALPYTPSDSSNYYVFNDKGQYYRLAGDFGGYGTYEIVDGSYVFNGSDQFGPVFLDTVTMQANDEDMTVNVYRKVSDDTSPKDNANFSLGPGRSPYLAYSIFPVGFDRQEACQTELDGTDQVRLAFIGEDQIRLSFTTWGGDETREPLLLHTDDLTKDWPTEISASDRSGTLQMILSFCGPWSLRAEIYGLPEGDYVMYFDPGVG